MTVILRSLDSRLKSKLSKMMAPFDGHIRESGFREQGFDIEVTSDDSHDESLKS